MNQPAEVITLPKAENALAILEPYEQQLAEIEREYATRVYNLENPDELKQAKTDRMKISKSITAVEDARKKAKADAQAIVKKVDAKGKNITDKLVSIRDRIWDPIKEFEARAEKIQAKIDDIAKFGTQSLGELSVSELETDIESVKSLVSPDSTGYGDRLKDALAAQKQALDALEAAKERRIQYDKDQAELERLRKAEAERQEQERIKAETDRQVEEERRKLAEERERLEAEAKQKADAELKAAQERAEAAEREAKESAEKERQRIEAEQRQKVEEERKAKEEDEARKQQKEHRAKIHREAKECLIMALIENGIELSSDTATQIITLIKDGKIEHVIINY